MVRSVQANSGPAGMVPPWARKTLPTAVACAALARPTSATLRTDSGLCT